MPARRKAAESATTPRKTKDSAGGSVDSSQKYTVYVKERSSVTSLLPPDVNPFSREEAIYWQLSFPKDLRKIIVAEVRNHMKSEYDKVLPSMPIEPNTEHIRNLVSHEVKQITNEVKNEVKREISIRTGSRPRGFRGVEMIEIIRQEARKVVLEELLVFSQDKINKPDFALHSSGANVISRFTSKTYELWPDKWYKKTAAYLFGQGILRGKPPVTAISPDTHVGQCWPFSGSEGQLAILLNRRVYVTAVTYDHVSRNVSIDVNSAPKEFEVWGIIDDGKDRKESETEENGDLDVEPFEESYMESIEEECGIRQEGEYEPDRNFHFQVNGNSNDGLGDLDLMDNITSEELHLGNSPLHLFLGRYVYNISSVPVQTFEVPQEILESNKPVRAVIMKVNSNWGKPGFFVHT
ncbi:16020_t:CDS:2 [Funneliformis mosseae]|uniref:16020_t:CDS:1 n=1 Tax=Funneliformis mosseae TaxID=27381 RepID=A0A9N8ZDD8_FUNMO|nr:16020_t:CDS:2 [Funneliformis mosseae]